MKVEVSMPALMKSVSLNAVVTGARRTGVRIWIGGKIMMLAAAVMGCSVDVSIAE